MSHILDSLLEDLEMDLQNTGKSKIKDAKKETLSDNRQDSVKQVATAKAEKNKEDTTLAKDKLNSQLNDRFFADVSLHGSKKPVKGKIGLDGYDGTNTYSYL